MRYDTAEASLTNQVKTAWAALHPTIPAYGENDPLPTYDQQNQQLHIEIRGGAQRVAGWGGLGNNRYRQSGEVIMRILVPSETGKPTASTLATDAASTLLGYRDGDLVVDASAPSAGEGTVESGNVFLVAALASFYFDFVG